MTPAQIKLARHALGLKRGQTKSYRNSFVAAPEHAAYTDWQSMVAAGNAVKFDGLKMPFVGKDLFRVTRAGATIACLPGDVIIACLPGDNEWAPAT